MYPGTDDPHPRPRQRWAGPYLEGIQRLETRKSTESTDAGFAITIQSWCRVVVKPMLSRAVPSHRCDIVRDCCQNGTSGLLTMSRIIREYI